MIELPSILEHLKEEYHIMCHTRNKNMNQPMQVHGKQLIYIWIFEFYCTIHTPDHLVPTKSNPHTDLSLLNIHILSPPIPLFISYLNP